MTAVDSTRRRDEPGQVLRDASADGRFWPLAPNRFGDPRTGFACACCGREVVTSVAGVMTRRAAGSPQRFCSPACREAGRRRRRAGVPENTPLQPGGGGTRSLTRDRTEAGR